MWRADRLPVRLLFRPDLPPRRCHAYRSGRGTHATARHPPPHRRLGRCAGELGVLHDDARHAAGEEDGEPGRRLGVSQARRTEVFHRPCENPACVSARSIFATVATSGVCLVFSIRLTVSVRTPASLASCAWERPAALRRAMMFRAMDARTYVAAGTVPSAARLGSGGRTAPVRWANSSFSTKT